MKTGKLELQKLQGFKIAEKNGRKFVFAWIDETRLFHSEATDRLYCDLVMFETPNSEYSDFAVKESLKKEEDKDKTELPIIGNFTNYVKKAEEGEATEEAKTEPGTDDDLPF